ncbi:hypothetical protein [Lachnoanaerobaculum umeaense]|uniref:Uncharacterized protein n=1 Tax=Lachnoanaerobaculum umeaense TaxID=617123 RepID=A0A385PZT3_9FIRM|nr:hypothetical protein [Lachnoanaerobaculum umeaense]AYA98787.1 hypothetical protein D4A81_01890 [Lachnoanaerobaculum umeaense]PZX00037.1 hypothetical protein C7439_101133 [Lachnoanaerobaculum umeaense]
MGFFISTLAFGIFSLLCFILAVFIYFRLLIAVYTFKKLPKWIYTLGHIQITRRPVHLDDITDKPALIEASVFMLCIILVNIIVTVVNYFKLHNMGKAIFSCLQMQFAIIIAAIILSGITRPIIRFLIPTYRTKYSYSTTNALDVLMFFASFAFTFFISIAGIPAKPVNVQIAGTNVIIGSTKASVLLDNGFTFKDKNADSEIINTRSDHFYYGEYLELYLGDKSFGHVCVTPTWKDLDELKNCTITSFKATPNDTDLSAVKFNNITLSDLELSDFENKDLIDIFSLHPIVYDEMKGPYYFVLTLQTHDYSLWKRYRIEADFNSDNSISNYTVMAQHTIWE